MFARVVIAAVHVVQFGAILQLEPAALQRTASNYMAVICERVRAAIYDGLLLYFLPDLLPQTRAATATSGV